MSKVEELYQGHLDRLREKAEENKIPFVDYLRAAYRPLEKNALLAILLRGEHSKESEVKLISRYRLEFFEMVANEAIKYNQSAIDALANNKAIELSQAAVAAQKKQVEALAVGRKKATASRKGKGDELKEQIKTLNDDLLNRPASEGWTIEARANHIAKKVDRKESYVRRLIATPRNTNQA